MEGAKIAFSALDAAVAGPIEDAFAQAGCFVCSNASNHRMNPFVPLVIPEVNPGHLALLNSQGYGRGGIITNPNCSTAGIALALAPLHRRFGVEAAVVTTMQSLSGAGYPGVPALDVAANVIPHIAGEEEKIEAETIKILGEPGTPAAMRISAQCNRVGTMVGHLAAVSVRLRSRATFEDVSEAFSSFRPLEGHGLPSAPMSPIILVNEPDRPQPVRDAGRGGGMSVTIGKLCPDPVLHYKFTLLVNNLVRGAAGAAILNAEFVALLAAEQQIEYF
ncbi:aspartate-semialdehyde dehydrogenase [bacterium]|nr:MAG: aspartate-semialdehyde dehydrogenase [bacterium]